MMCMIICSILSQLLQNQDIRHVCRKFNIRVVWRTLRSMLTKVKDTLDYLLIQCGISYPLHAAAAKSSLDPGPEVSCWNVEEASYISRC